MKEEGGGGNCGNMFGDLFFVRTVTETCWYYFPKIAYLQMNRLSFVYLDICGIKISPLTSAVIF
jgi:hypothetical protein